MSRKKRIQFDFTPAESDLLDDLVDQTGHRSRAEVIRRAMNLYNIAVRAAQSGHTLQIEKSDGTSERINFMP